MWKHLLCAVLLLALTLPLTLPLVGCGGTQSTPQTTASGYKQAMAERDWERAFGFLTPKARGEMLGAVFITGVYGSQRDPAKAKAFRELTKEQGFGQGIATLKESEKVPEIFAAVVEWIEANLVGEDGGSAFDLAEEMAASVFSDFEIEADRAEANMLSQGQTKRVQFTRIDGRWFLDI